MFAITPPGGPEWIVIALIFVLMFGAKKLPELGGSVGKSIRNFKKGVSEAGEEDQPADQDAVTDRTPSGSSSES